VAKSSPLSGRIGPRFGGRSARKRTRIIVASIFVVLAGSFATTLAANVTINQNKALEFGQGQVPAIACDQSVTTAITEEWNNSTTNFHVKTVTLNGLNIAPSPSATINDQGCGEKTLKVSLLDTNGSPLPMGSGTPTQIAFTVPTAPGIAATVSPAGASVVISGNAPDYTATITLPTSSPSASDVRATATAVARVTIETD
jgi:MFS family permease